jgi:acyl-CoA thioester hydrolase
VKHDMPAVFQHKLTVSSEDVDWMGHANNVSYFYWLQDAAVAHSAAQGWTSVRYREIGQAWVARTHTIDYLKPAVAGDELVVQTWVRTLARVTSERRYRVVRQTDQIVLATAMTKWAFVDIKAGVPRRIPADVSAAFEIVHDPDEHL